MESVTNYYEYNDVYYIFEGLKGLFHNGLFFNLLIINN